MDNIILFYFIDKKGTTILIIFFPRAKKYETKWLMWKKLLLLCGTLMWVVSPYITYLIICVSWHYLDSCIEIFKYHPKTLCLLALFGLIY